jgi:hypothetical protein
MKDSEYYDKSKSISDQVSPVTKPTCIWFDQLVNPATKSILGSIQLFIDSTD